MAKSAVCIGVVSALALGMPRGEDLDTLVRDGGRGAAAGLGRACAGSETCVGAGQRIAAAVLGQSAALPASVTRAGLASASDLLSAPEPLPAAAAKRPPHEAERRGRRAAAQN